MVVIMPLRRRMGAFLFIERREKSDEFVDMIMASLERLFYRGTPDAPPAERPVGALSVVRYAELHCHSNFSFLDGASPADDLVERAVELGLTGLAVDRPPRPVRRGPVRRRRRGGRAAPDRRHRDRAARPGRRRIRTTGRRPAASRRVDDARSRPSRVSPTAGRSDGRPPVHDRSAPGCPAIATRSRRTCAASGRTGPRATPRPAARRDLTGWRSLCRLLSRGQPRRDEGRAALPPRRCSRRDHEGVVALSGVSPRRDRAGGCWSAIGAGARAAAERLRRDLRRGDGASGFCIELSHHLLPDDDWLVAESAALAARAAACRSSSPTTSTTRRPRTASSRTCWRRSGTAGRSTRWPTCADPTASRT